MVIFLLLKDIHNSHLAPAHKVNALAIPDGAINRRPIIQKLYNPAFKCLAGVAN